MRVDTVLNDNIKQLAENIDNDEKTIESERVKVDENRMKLKKQNEIIALPKHFWNQ